MSKAERFAEKLRHLIRTKTSENMKVLSKRLGINHLWLRRAVTKGINYRTNRTDRNLLPLCQFLGVRPENLFDPIWTTEDVMVSLRLHYPKEHFLVTHWYTLSGQMHLDYLYRKIDPEQMPTLGEFTTTFSNWIKDSYLVIHGERPSLSKTHPAEWYLLCKALGDGRKAFDWMFARHGMTNDELAHQINQGFVAIRREDLQTDE